MRIVIAPDSFKGSLSAAETASALARGLLRALPDARFDLLPLSDGGEGWVRTLTAGGRGRIARVRVTGPVGDPVEAAFGLVDDDAGVTGIVEMAQASGLALLEPGSLDAAAATTYGTGELMAAALDAGAGRLLIGAGGSATNDGGAGMAAALGVSFRRSNGSPVEAGGAALAQLASLDTADLDARVREAEVVLATDVDNPLIGERGASAVYGPQKGASPELVAELDAALAHFASCVESALGDSWRDEPGAGAAGGLGFGLLAFAGAAVAPGIEVALDALGANGIVEGADLVITGEGRIDEQTLAGKVPIGVARRASAYGVPVIAVGGSVAPMDEEIRERFAAEGIGALYATTAAAPGDITPQTAAAALEQAAERAGNAIAAGEMPLPS